ncbi:MAG TPA: SDR family NAD(P)-dependent oxidoreductase, partial [Burkholderiales bacterium]
MDLGLRGKTALVCAASKGLGKGCAVSLAREGVNLVITARGREALEAAAAELRTHGVKVTTIAGDITTPEGRAAALAACPAPDILVNNAGGPPTGDFREWNAEIWMKALNANMLTPIELIKATVDKMIERRWGRIVNITSSAVKAPIDILGLSNGARAGLTGFVAGLSREVAKYNVTINNLLPGSHETDRLIKLTRAEAKERRISMETALAETAEEIRKATGNRVTSVVADVTTGEGRAALLSACANPDILITNSGGPPAGDFRDWNEYEWHQAVQNNMITHIMLMKAVVDGMIDRRWGRIVNITSAAVKAPYPTLGLS